MSEGKCNPSFIAVCGRDGREWIVGFWGGIKKLIVFVGAARPIERHWGWRGDFVEFTRFGEKMEKFWWQGLT